MTKETPSVNLREQINENLKRVYEQELSREVPDRFRALLDQLQRQEPEK